MRFVITEHAIERFRERVRTDLSAREARSLLQDVASRSTALRERTFGGQEQRRVDEPRCVLVCKRDPGAIVVVTVLGPDEVLTEADEETLAEFERFMVDEFARRTTKQYRTASRPAEFKAAPRATDEEIRALVVRTVRHEIGPAADKFLGAFEKKAKQLGAEYAIEDARRGREEAKVRHAEFVVRQQENAREASRMKTERMRIAEEAAIRRNTIALRVALSFIAGRAETDPEAARVLAEIYATDENIRGIVEGRKTDAA